MQVETKSGDSQTAPISVGKRVVMIDDQATYTEALATAFGMMSDLDVIGKATTGNVGVEIALELQPDLVLCDYRMPGGNTGIECAEQLRKNGFGGEIVILTGHAAPHVHEEAEQISDVRVISKDLNIPDIISIISTINAGTMQPADLATVINQKLDKNPTGPSRRPKKLVVAGAAIATVVVAAVGIGMLNESNQDTAPTDRTSIAGVVLERPFVVVDGTATNVRVAVEIDGQLGDSFTPSNLPTTIAIDTPSPGSEVRVVVENLDNTGTTTCAIGVSKELLTTQTSQDNTTTCTSSLN